MRSANKNMPQKPWIWPAGNSQVTPPPWQVHVYLVTHPHLWGQPIAAKDNLTYFYSSCASSPDYYFFLNNPASSWNSMIVTHHCCGLHLIPPICISCAHPTDEFYELTFEHIHPKQVTAHWGVLAACPHFCLCQTPSFAPALHVQGLHLAFLHTPLPSCSTTHHPHRSAMTQPPTAWSSGTSEVPRSHLKT